MVAPQMPYPKLVGVQTPLQHPHPLEFDQAFQALFVSGRNTEPLAGQGTFVLQAGHPNMGLVDVEPVTYKLNHRPGGQTFFFNQHQQVLALAQGAISRHLKDLKIPGLVANNSVQPRQIRGEIGIGIEIKAEIGK